MHLLPAVRLGTMRVVSGGSEGSELSADCRPSTVHRPGTQLPLFDDFEAVEPAPWETLDERRRGTAFLQIPVRTVLNPPASTGMGFWSLNPYVGCEFGCSYCYARDTHRYQMERAAKDEGRESGAGALPAWQAFEQRIFVKTDAAQILARTLNPAKLAGQSLVIGTSTDPYQPAERTFQLTRQILEALLDHRGYSIGLITKSALVTRDIPIWQQLSERHDVTINISLISTNARLVRRLERRSPIPQARLRALTALTTAGLNAGIMMAPILPGITDDHRGLEAMMRAGQTAGARYVVGIPLRLDPVSRRRFWPVLQQEFPQLVERYRRCYGPRSYARRPYLSALIQRVRQLQQQYGFPVQGDSRRQRQEPHQAARQLDACVQMPLL
ncbi:MAG: radical SAM protein [Gemmatimonadales bacterium]